MHESKNMKIGAHCILAGLYFLLLPTTIAINSAGNSILKLATVPIGLFFAITILFSKKELQFNIVHLLLCVFTCSTALTLFVDASAVSIDYVIGYFLNAVLYICLTVVKYNDQERKLLEDIQVLLLVTLVGITLLSNGTRLDRTTLEIFGQTCDPNYFVGFFVFPLAVTMKKIVQSKYRMAYILLALLSIYCVFLSGSRGGLLAIIVTVVAFAFIYPPKAKHKIAVLAAGCSFMFFVWFLVLPILPENIIARMSVEQVVETGGTGRWYIWESMLNEIVNSPDELFLGRGIRALHTVFLGGKWEQVGAHNQIIEVLYNQGIVGLAAFIALTAGCLLRCIRKRKMVAIAIIGMMALSISLGFNQTTRTFWNLIAYAAFNFSEDECCASTGILKLSEEDGL